MCYISVLLYRNSLILTSIALIITVVSNAIYKHSTDDFPLNGPEWLKSVSKFVLNNGKNETTELRNHFFHKLFNQTLNIIIVPY